MPIYMNYDGVTGDVTSEGHENWVALQSLQWASTRPISSGASANRTKSAVTVSEVVISKEYDSSSGKLIKEHFTGDPKSVQFDWTSTSDKGEIVYLTAKLTDALVSAYSTASSSSGAPMESVSLNFTEIEFTVYAREQVGTKASKPYVVNHKLADG